MMNNFRGNRKSHNRAAGSDSTWRTYLMVIIAGLSVTAIVGYGFYMGDRMSTVDAQMANNVMKAKLEAMMSNIVLEEALQKAHKNLEKKVAARTQELAGANEKLKAEISERKHAENQLQQNMIMLQAIFDGISDNLILVNKDMGIKLINKAAGRYYGIQSSQDAVLFRSTSLF